LVLCSSNARCAEWVETANQICYFCGDVIEILSLEGDDGDIKNEMKRILQMSKRNQKEESKTSQDDQELIER
jgi:hypothetical protein